MAVKVKGRGLLAPRQTASAKSKKTRSNRGPKTTGQGLFAGNLDEIIQRSGDEARRTARESFNLNNRASESNPFGTRETWINPDGTTGERTTLDASQQRQLALQNAREEGLGTTAQQLTGQVGTAYSSPYDLSGLKNDPNSLDFSAERARIEGEIYNRYKQDLDTQFAQDNANFARRMASQGIPEGSTQYNRLLREQQQNQARAYQDARTQAVQSSGDEMTRSFGMAMDSRSRAVDEYNMGRDRPFQELSNILGGMNGPQLPNFQARGMTEIQPTNVEGLATTQMQLNQQAQQNKWQANQNAKDRAAQLRAAGMSRGGGGGGYDDAAYRAQLQADTDAYAQRQEIANRYKQNIKKPSSLVQAGTSLLGGLAQGAGAAATNYFMKKGL